MIGLGTDFSTQPTTSCFDTYQALFTRSAFFLSVSSSSLPAFIMFHISRCIRSFNSSAYVRVLFEDIAIYTVDAATLSRRPRRS